MIRRSRRRSTSRVPSGFDPPARAIGPVLQGHAQVGEPVADLVGQGKVLLLAKPGAEVDQELEQGARQRVAPGLRPGGRLAEEAQDLAQLLEDYRTSAKSRYR